MSHGTLSFSTKTQAIPASARTLSSLRPGSPWFPWQARELADCKLNGSSASLQTAAKLVKGLFWTDWLREDTAVGEERSHQAKLCAARQQASQKGGHHPGLRSHRGGHPWSGRQ